VRNGGPARTQGDAPSAGREKVRRADFAYVNDGSLEDLDRFVASVVERLTSS
jgi:hypothetical protein